MKEHIYYIFPYFVGYLFAVVLGQIFIKNIMGELKKEIKTYLFKNGDIANAYGWYAHKLGYIEEILYVTSLLLGHAEFIAAWLTFKIVGRWASPDLERKERRELLEREKTTPEQKLIFNNAEYNLFTIGNALSIIYAVVGWKIIIWLGVFKINNVILVGGIIILGSWIFYELAKKQTIRLRNVFAPNKIQNSNQKEIRMKKCPYCTEEIQEAAIKCRYCNSFLSTPDPKELVDEKTIKREIGKFLFCISGLFFIASRIWVNNSDLFRILFIFSSVYLGISLRAFFFVPLLNPNSKQVHKRNAIVSYVYYSLMLGIISCLVYFGLFHEITDLNPGLLKFLLVFVFFPIGLAAATVIDKFGIG